MPLFSIIIYEHNDPEKIGLTCRSIDRNLAEVLVIGKDEASCETEAINVGISCCTGEYCLFAHPGDVFHPELFKKLSCIISENYPDLISFGIAWSMREENLFNREPYDHSDYSCHVFLKAIEKSRFLSDEELYESYLSFAYKKEFLIESGAFFISDVYDEDNSFVLPLLLYAESIAVMPEHGYCRYSDPIIKKEAVKARIVENLKCQIELLDYIQKIPLLWNEYRELILAHFLKRYYLHTIDLARTSAYDDVLGLMQFQIIQLVCLKLVPGWICNEYIYGMPEVELNRLKLLHRRFETDEELHRILYDGGLVTCIITTYNRASILSRAIRNVLEQSYQRIELIIVDDFSTDNTEEIVRLYNDDRIKYIKNSENKGVTKSRNVGLCKARGEYVVYQDDDDIGRLNRIEKMVHNIERLSVEYGAVYHEVQMLKKSNNSVSVIPDKEITIAFKSGFVFPALLPKNFIDGPSMLIKKSVLDEMEGFDENLFAYEDWDLALRISRKYKVHLLGEILYEYIRSEDGMICKEMDEHRAKIIKALYDIDLKFETDRKEYGIQSQIRVVEG